VPARRKFLRTEQTELAHIASLVTHYSLAHIDKTFFLAHEKGQLLNVTPVPELRERVFQVFGRSTLDDLVELEPLERPVEIPASPVPPTQAAAAHRSAGPAQNEILRLTGFVSKPQIQKLNRNSIYIFVNRRLIRDRLLLRAISSAYYNITPPGTFPFALLFLDLPFQEVDVNVHPSKTEVRFRHQSQVHDFVRDGLRQQLIQSKPISTFPMGPRPAGGPQGAAVLPFSEETERLGGAELPEGQAKQTLSLRPEPTMARLDFGEAAPIEGAEPLTRGALVHSDSVQAAAAGSPRTEWPGRLPENAGAAPAAAGAASLAQAIPTVGTELHSRAPLVDTAEDSLRRLGDLRPLGQIKDSFIVAAGPDGLWIIDQHVAHERILFERVLRQRTRGEIESQRLLIPIILNLKPDQEVVFAQIEQEFRANGFDIEPFGRRTIAVKACPAGLSPREVEALVQEILDTPEKELRELSLGDLHRRVAATIACHAAIKVNTTLDADKMQWLLTELAKTDCPMSCPHGRPIALKYSLKEILKAFHRI
jgi:DNA mismatch repair protein MutL